MDPKPESEAVVLTVDTGGAVGDIDLARYSLGQGGLTDRPMIEPHTEQLAQLRPQTIRLFVQDYFNLYPDHGRYHWESLDKSLACIAATGARPELSLCFKPRILFPVVDQDAVQPTSYEEWEELVFQLVRHVNTVRGYGAQYWEVGNEPDLGEAGGCPYRFAPAEYLAYYRHTASAILRADPAARVGGPALSDHRHPIGSELMAFAADGEAPLDFFSWHVYDSSPEAIRRTVSEVRDQLAQYPALEDTETVISEWNMSLSRPDPRPGFQAAFVLDVTRAMHEERLSRASYYHVRDVFVDPGQFSRFLSPEGAAGFARYWNIAPQYCGIYDNQGRTRPTYYVFRLLGLIRGAHHAVQGENSRVKALAATHGRNTTIVYWNFPGVSGGGPAEVSVQFPLPPGSTYRYVRINPDANVNNLETLRAGDASELQSEPLGGLLEPYGIRWIEITRP